jgi:hypothetical protein
MAAPTTPSPSYEALLEENRRLRSELAALRGADASSGGPDEASDDDTLLPPLPRVERLSAAQVSKANTQPTTESDPSNRRPPPQTPTLPSPSLATLSSQISRYSRQLLVPAVGVEGQRRLLQSSVLVVGAGMNNYPPDSILLAPLSCVVVVSWLVNAVAI